MAITATEKVVPDWFTPDGEWERDEDGEKTKPKKNATKFQIQPLTAPQLEDVFEMTSQGMGVPSRNYSLVLKYGLKDWTANFKDKKGKKLKANFTNHHRIPFDTRSELVGEIITRSQLSEDEAGN